MTTSQSHKLHKLKKMLMPTGGEKAECTMCKFVLYFAFTSLFLVLVFVFFFRLQPPDVLDTPPPSQTAFIAE